MRRKSFDVIVGVGGLLLTVALVAAGALAILGVQLRQQHGHQPAVGPEDHLPERRRFRPGQAGHRDHPRDAPYLQKYAGEEMATGAQAEAYANHFIAVHLQEIGGGKTYSELSGAPAMALPKGERRYTLSRSDSARPCSKGRRCAACCSTPTAGGRWARSPS